MQTEDEHIYEDFCEEEELSHDDNNSLWAIKFAKYYQEKKGQNLPIHSVIDNGVINKWVSIDGENFQVYNVNLMLTPEDDGNFKYVWYQDLRG